MTSSSQLETWTSDLAVAAKTLDDHYRGDGTASPSHSAITNVSPFEADRARRNILAITTRLQTLLAEPAEFIQQLASQNQLLACLKWLGQFQVLACIPLSGSIAAKEVADLVGVPETQLYRIVRMTATAGFLREPQPGQIAHTALSAPFVTSLSFLDAAMFLAETAAPTALHMGTAAQSHGSLDSASESAYSVTFNTSQTFQSACVERKRLQRQWSAYRRCTGDVDDSVTELLSQLNWRSLGNACIVDTNEPVQFMTNSQMPRIDAIALADMYPALHFIVQVIEPAQNSIGTVGAGAGKAKDFSERITVQKRMPAATQVVKDAAVYILRLTTPCPSLPTTIIAELSAHLGVLRANASATLILAPPLLPEPGTVDPDVEAMARLKDLSHMQLTNECGLGLSELIEMVNSVHDSRGRLVVVNKLRSHDRATVALGVQYQAYADGPVGNLRYREAGVGSSNL
ncbi:MAG: hypothetical protein Q9191_001423 [Dirinaria sp. TL-2023a]